MTTDSATTEATKVAATEAAAQAAAENGGAARADEGGSRRSRFIAWSRATWHQFESWSTSAVLHVVGLVLLAVLTLSIPVKQDPERIIQAEQRPVEEVNQRLESEVLETTDVSLSVSNAIGQTHSDQLQTGPAPQLERRMMESDLGAEVSLADVGLRVMPGLQLTSELDLDSPGEPSAVVEGYAGAMDRITQEILLMLAKEDVLLVWLFDQSESMEEDRAEIRERIEGIYKQLGLDTGDQAESLLTAVASFGEDVAHHSRRPTADVAKIREEIDDVPVDESGQERICYAIANTAQKYRRYARQGNRKLALIVVTDESGNDGEEIEFAINAARESECRVYVLGRESPFGYPYLFRHWIWEDPEGKEKPLDFWLRIDRGPETPLVEQLQTNGLWRRRDAHPSGFGPYEQVRLCRETGGMYFLLPDWSQKTVNAENWRYDIEAMRPYLPDLISRGEYEQAQNESELRRSLWEIISTLNPWQRPEINLRERFHLEPERYQEEFPPEIQKTEVLIPLYAAAESQLESLRRARDQHPSPRWQANYDLMYAQTVCYKVRTYEYAAYLAAFAQNPKAVTKPATTTYWRVEHRPRTITEEAEEAAAQATELFEAVIREHEGTPYAKRAEWELARGFGIELVEDSWDPRHETLGPGIKKPNL